jgi:plastocyanin
MKHTLTVSFMLSLLLSASPTALAFFGELDGLKQMIASAQVEADDGLVDLLAQIHAENPGAFKDVQKSEWFYPFVAAVVDWGIVSGYRDAEGDLTGMYGPGDQLSRAQILKMVVKAAQIDESTCVAEPMHPQASGHWAKVFVGCAETLGMRSMRNHPDLDAPATRAEVVSMIHDGFTVSVPALFSNFSDTVNHPFESDIAYGNITGLVTGDTDANGNPTGMFRPDDGLKRAEGAKLIYQALRVYAEAVAQAASEEQRVTIVAKPGSFSPSIVTVKVGIPLTVTFINSGDHSFTIDELAVHQPLSDFQEKVTLTPTKIGTFPFYSAVEGDKAAGMIGTIIVH